MFVVVLAVIAPVAPSVVNDPVLGVVVPIAGGDAKYVLNPVPETVELALKVVNAPVPAVVAPMFMLFMLPAVPEVIVIAPAPVVV